jgi:acyl carrier protein
MRQEAAAGIRAQGPHDGRRALLLLVRDHVTQVLGLEPREAPAPHQGFFSIGFDSLMALELKNRLSAALGVPLPSTLAFDHPSIRELAEYLARQVLHLDTTPGRDVSAAVVTEGAAGDVDASIAVSLARFERVMVKP